jgi:tetratricopeptide (TPR) repeat protein
LAPQIDSGQLPDQRLASDEPVSGDAPSENLVIHQKGVRSAAASDREILLRGRRAFDRGEDATALENLSRLARHGNEYADVHYMIGMLEERKGDLGAALESLRRAIRVNPSYVEALLALASLHERQGDFDLSQSYAERASQLTQPNPGELDPTTRGKLANQQAALGDALVEAGERRDGIEAYRAALERCPSFHDIRHRLGVTLREAGLPFQAAQEFRHILRVHPAMLESRIQLGLTYYSLGRTPEAVREWEAVLESEPGRDEARMYLRLVRGAAQERQAVGPGQGWSTRPLGAAVDATQLDSLEDLDVAGSDLPTVGSLYPEEPGG